MLVLNDSRSLQRLPEGVGQKILEQLHQRPHSETNAVNVPTLSTAAVSIALLIGSCA